MKNYSNPLISVVMVGLMMGMRVQGQPTPSADGGPAANATRAYIVGGGLSDISQTPWVISLQRGRGAHTCGATLISGSAGVTAGHCFPDGAGNPGSFQAVLSRGTPNEEAIDLTQIIIHEKFQSSDQTSPVYDVAVIKLSSPSKSVTSFATLNDQADVSGSSARVVGWGLESLNGAPSEKLKGLDVVVGAQIDGCSNAKGYDAQVTICAKAQTGDDTPCMGDSGGPLFIAPNRLIGAVSYGNNCKGGAAYAKIAQFVDWINSNAGGSGGGGGNQQQPSQDNNNSNYPNNNNGNGNGNQQQQQPSQDSNNNYPDSNNGNGNGNGNQQQQPQGNNQGPNQQQQQPQGNNQGPNQQQQQPQGNNQGPNQQQQQQPQGNNQGFNPGQQGGQYPGQQQQQQQQQPEPIPNQQGGQNPNGGYPNQQQQPPQQQQQGPNGMFGGGDNYSGQSGRRPRYGFGRNYGFAPHMASF